MNKINTIFRNNPDFKFKSKFKKKKGQKSFLKDLPTLEL